MKTPVWTDGVSGWNYFISLFFTASLHKHCMWTISLNITALSSSHREHGDRTEPSFRPRPCCLLYFWFCLKQLMIYKVKSYAKKLFKISMQRKLKGCSTLYSFHMTDSAELALKQHFAGYKRKIKLHSWMNRLNLNNVNSLKSLVGGQIIISYLRKVQLWEFGPQCF